MRWVKEGKSEPMSLELSKGLDWLIEHFETAGPRIVSGARSERPILVFTDGACEDEGTTVGAIIYEVGRTAECFGLKVNQDVVDTWKGSADQKQVIGQAELYPLLLARLTWGDRLAGRRVIYFVDNESARIGMVRAYSPFLPSLQLILECLSWDYKNESQGWYSRVASFSNCADALSRLITPTDASVRVVKPVFPVGQSSDVLL